jgi:hypothetical protein
MGERFGVATGLEAKSMGPGRLAQRESSALTRQRPWVRSPDCPLALDESRGHLFRQVANYDSSANLRSAAGNGSGKGIGVCGESVMVRIMQESGPTAMIHTVNAQGMTPYLRRVPGAT